MQPKLIVNTGGNPASDSIRTYIAICCEGHIPEG